jgi:glycogen debranching enzyme
VEAWRWGLDDRAVEPLLGALQAAVGWLLDDSDADGDGLCEYVDSTGNGLGNQGWKDSGDAVNWQDGTLASAPIALVEVQGYAYEAACNALQLYAHFHLPGAERIERFARDRRYNPLSYHNGSIWPHDTAICARGMILAGHPWAATKLLAGLLKAATAFDNRLPELFSSIDENALVVPYPASCRPPAWAAAVAPLYLWATAPLLPSQPGTTPRQLAGAELATNLDVDGFAYGGRRITAHVHDGVTVFQGLG